MVGTLERARKFFFRSVLGREQVDGDVGHGTGIHPYLKETRIGMEPYWVMACKEA